MKNLYNEDYYERGIENNVSCYSNYRWIPELTIPMAARILEYLKIKEDETILDFGCAKGYLVKAFRLLHRNAYGFDISEYAISNAPNDIKDFLYNKLIDNYDWIISKDVFEHIPYENISNILQDLRKRCKKMFVVVPLGDGKKYNIPSYELDKTHIIKENIGWWKSVFTQAGFNITEAEYKIKYIKENWASWDNGNGFFVLENK
ncbi:hypothetical protein AGMMS49546_38810 [Spirochaetia bacterium]|nr:hypothetical protein AGMMS49546_38810 [Spirochaetia bacterium]